MSIKKIVVIGPESTGKSTLCEQLAKHYQTLWAKEYAREYLLKNGTTYTFEQLLEIAKGQLTSEDKCILKAQETRGKEQEIGRQLSTVNYQPIFIDTDMYVMKVWSEYVFDKCHSWILKQITERKYDLYLLCNVDLPWVKDELREYPDLASRQKLYHYYKDAMINQSIPWIDISGDYNERLKKAIEAVNKVL
jgi:NadR type nicotinamide-nucleotide adenylyltransferase